VQVVGGLTRKGGSCVSFCTTDRLFKRVARPMTAVVRPEPKPNAHRGGLFAHVKPLSPTKRSSKVTGLKVGQKALGG
jgi:hypothetical protein